jgi:hypothetical protein
VVASALAHLTPQPQTVVDTRDILRLQHRSRLGQSRGRGPAPPRCDCDKPLRGRGVEGPDIPVLAVHWRCDRTCPWDRDLARSCKEVGIEGVAVRVTQGDHLELVFQGDDKKFGAERAMSLVPRADGRYC